MPVAAGGGHDVGEFALLAAVAHRTQVVGAAAADGVDDTDVADRDRRAEAFQVDDAEGLKDLLNGAKPNARRFGSTAGPPSNPRKPGSV